MSTSPPDSMRAVALATLGAPSTYDIATLPIPKITQDDEMLIKVAAASINPIDVKLAGGLAKVLGKPTFPYKIGYDVSGTVVAVGSAVTSFKPGDEVYSRVPGHLRGTLAQYCLTTSYATALKPASLDFSRAAAIPLAGITALQCLEDADKHVAGGLKGKTVFIPGGLSGVGSFAVQIARNVFGAKVVTTLSPGKIAIAEKLFGQENVTYIDYTKGDVVEKIGRHSVDVFFNTMKGVLTFLPVVKKGGYIVSISGLPSGKSLRDAGNPDMSILVYWIMNVADWFYRVWTGWSGVGYRYMWPDMNGETLDRLSGFFKEGKLIPVVGKTARLDDLEGLREGCGQVYEGKGGLGKFVVEVE